MLKTGEALKLKSLRHEGLSHLVVLVRTKAGPQISLAKTLNSAPISRIPVIITSNEAGLTIGDT